MLQNTEKGEKQIAVPMLNTLKTHFFMVCQEMDFPWPL